MDFIKKLKSIILHLLLVSLVIGSISCSDKLKDDNNDNDRNINFCSSQLELTIDLIRKCNIDTTPIMSNINTFSICSTYQNYGISGSYDDYKRCIKNLESLSCEDLSEIETENDLKKIDSCLNIPKKTKKEVCIINHTGYCINNIYNKCGYEKLPQNCYKTGTKVDDEGRTKVVLDETRIKDYCENTINGDEDIATVKDFFYETCGDYENLQVDCNNIQEIDFRNDSWKTQCTKE